MPQPVRIKAQVEQVVEHDALLRTLVLALERPAPRFRPGQFLHLAIDPYEPSGHWPESRIFSIASSPEQRRAIHITFSAVGRFTTRMLDLAAGDDVWLKLPYGEFCVTASLKAPAVLVAGGTGVTPFMSLLSESVPPSGPMWLLYGARRPELLIYRHAVEQATARWSELLRATMFVESGSEPGLRRARLGIEDAVTAARELGAVDRAVFYVSGSPAMLGFFQSGLAREGVEPRRIRIDAWGDG